MKRILVTQFQLQLGFAATLALFSGLIAQSLTVPPQVSSPDKPSGAVLFHEKGCEYCHGVHGIGVEGKGPSLLTVGKRLKRDAIAKQIHDGGQAMPAFGDALQPDELSALADMLAKQKKAPKHLPQPASTPTPSTLK